jgi:hypothetical protein
VTIDEFTASIAAVHNDPEFDLLRYSISDFLDVQSFSVDVKTVTMAVAYALGAAITNKSMKLAIVTVDPKVLELVELYAKRVPYSLKTFSKLGDARDWVADKA